MLLFKPAEVEARLREQAAAGAFPGAAALWGRPLSTPALALAGHRGSSRDRQPVTADLIYDLASVTKVLATTSLAMILTARGLLEPARPLTEIAPLAKIMPREFTASSFWRRVTAGHLLAHQSGLTAWRPFYRLGGVSPAARRAAALTALSEAEPEAEPGRRTIYSDLNFILLGFLLEALAETTLDDLFKREIAEPLNLAAAGFRPLNGPLAPTEDGFRWGGPIGHSEAHIFGPTPLGRVNDDNAAWLGGVAGHAGLFAPVRDVWALAEDWGRAWKSGPGLIFDRLVLAEFLRPRPTLKDPGRPWGFNRLGNIAGLARSPLSPAAVGHTGYTGPAVWWDADNDFLWVLLCNRVHPRAANPAWRPGLVQGGLIASGQNDNIDG